MQNPPKFPQNLPKKSSKSQTILRKGQLTTKKYTLIEGVAVVEHEGHILHTFVSGDVFNQVELRYGCEMMKTVVGVGRVRVAVQGLFGERRDKVKEGQDKYIEVKKFLSKYCKSPKHLEQLTRYLSPKSNPPSQSPLTLTLTPSTHQLLLLTSGKIQISDEQKNSKKIQIIHPYPFFTTTGKKIYIRCLTQVTYFCVELGLFQVFGEQGQVGRIKGDWGVWGLGRNQGEDGKEKKEKKERKERMTEWRKEEKKENWRERRGSRYTHNPTQQEKRSKVMSSVLMAQCNMNASIYSRIAQHKKQKSLNMLQISRNTQSHQKFLQAYHSLTNSLHIPVPPPNPPPHPYPNPSPTTNKIP